MDELKTCICQYAGDVFTGLNGGIITLLEQHRYLLDLQEDLRGEHKNSLVPAMYKKDFPNGQVLVETLDFREHPKHSGLINDSGDYFTTLRLISTDETVLTQAKADLDYIHESRCLVIESLLKEE